MAVSLINVEPKTWLSSFLNKAPGIVFVTSRNNYIHNSKIIVRIGVPFSGKMSVYPGLILLSHI